MEISEVDLRRLLTDVAEIAVQKTLIATGNLKPYISLNQAYKMYGRSTVDRWAEKGLVKLLKDGDKNSRVRIDRVEIETVAKTSNRSIFFR